MEDCADQALFSLRSYVLGSDENLLQAGREGNKKLHNLESAKGLKDRRRAEHKAEWQEKTLYGQFLRQTENESNKKG